jgi:hypothetical protein
VASCKYCGGRIGWHQDDESRWVPIDPKTDRRHQCNAYERRKRQQEWSEAWRQGYAAGQRQNLHAPPSDALSLDFVTKLIWLCHPDHQPRERFALANTVTVDLIKLRDKLRIRSPP